MPSRFRGWGRIADIMVKYGFGILIDELAPVRVRFGMRRRAEVYGPVYTRVRLALEELGPTYVKFGQVMSARRDLLPPGLIEELKRLQDEVPPVPFAEVLPYVVEQCPALATCMHSIDPVPLAAASLSQVHGAVLADGSRVVLKLQRPGIAEIIEADIAIMKRVAAQVERRFPDLAMYNPTGMVREFEEQIRRELDFVRDGQNADRLRENMRNVRGVRVPRVYWHLSGPRILVMERIDGVRADNRAALRRLGIAGREVAELGLAAYVRQIFDDGFFHADPHPGNLLVTPAGEFVFLDFGIMGVLRPEKRRAFVALLTGFVERDMDALVYALGTIGIEIPPERVDHLKDELYLLVTRYRDLSVRQFDLGTVLGDGADLLRSNEIRLPSSLMRMLVVLMMVIDLGRTLDPGFLFTERIEPYLREAVRRDRFSADQAAATARGVREAAADTVALPGAIGAAARRFSRGPIEIDLVTDDFHRIQVMLDQAGDKILIGLVTAAIVVGSSLVLDRTAVALPGWITTIAGICYVGAVMIGFAAIYHVLRNRP
ncbi:MAG: AarF/UbiB family protein [Methanospirillum sp.]